MKRALTRVWEFCSAVIGVVLFVARGVDADANDEYPDQFRKGGLM